MEEPYKEFDSLMRTAEKEIRSKNYEKGLALVSEAEKLLMQLDDHPIRWAYIYNFRRYSLFELGKKEEAGKVCREALAKLNSFRGWVSGMYQNHHIYYEAIRLSCDMLAWEVFEKAENEQQLNEAIELVEECFSNSRYEGDLKPFYETKALVYQKAAQFNPDQYQINYLSALKEIHHKKPNIEDKRILAGLKSPEFAAFLKDDPIKKLMQGPEGETWQEALDRYQALREFVEKTNKRTPFGIDRISIREKATPEQIAEFEKKNNCQVPDSLKELYLQHGSFSMGGGEQYVIELYSINGIQGLVEAIDDVLYGDHQINENFSEADIAYFNNNYFVFGCYHHYDWIHAYFYFDRNGKFGLVYYDEDMDDLGFDDDDLSLLKNGLAAKTLDEVLSSQIDGLIYCRLGDEDIDDKDLEDEE